MSMTTFTIATDTDFKNNSKLIIPMPRVLLL